MYKYCIFLQSLLLNQIKNTLIQDDKNIFCLGLLM